MTKFLCSKIPPDLIFAVLFPLSFLNGIIALAQRNRVYNDSVYRIHFNIPAGWQKLYEREPVSRTKLNCIATFVNTRIMDECYQAAEFQVFFINNIDSVGKYFPAVKDQRILFPASATYDSICTNGECLHDHGMKALCKTIVYFLKNGESCFVLVCKSHARYFNKNRIAYHSIARSVYFD